MTQKKTVYLLYTIIRLFETSLLAYDRYMYQKIRVTTVEL